MGNMRGSVRTWRGCGEHEREIEGVRTWRGCGEHEREIEGVRDVGNMRGR